MRKISEEIFRTYKTIRIKPMTIGEIQKAENSSNAAVIYRIKKLRNIRNDVKVVDFRLVDGRPARVYGIGDHDVPYKSKEEILADQARQREHIFEMFRLWDAATRHAVMCRA